MNEQTFNETLEPAVQAVTDITTNIANNEEVMNYAEELMKKGFSKGCNLGLVAGVAIGIVSAFGVSLLIDKLTHKKKETEVTETNEE